MDDKTQDLLSAYRSMEDAVLSVVNVYTAVLPQHQGWRLDLWMKETLEHAAKDVEKVREKHR